MRIVVPHHTTRDQARTRVEQKIGQLLSEVGGRAEEIHHEWSGDVLRFRGKARGLAVEGTVEVTDATVILDAGLPLLAKPFEGRIRQAVEREADALFRSA
jgi:hypothetical protein